MGYSPWGCKELDTTEWLIHMHTGPSQAMKAKIRALVSLRPYLAVLASVCPCPTSHLHSLPYKSRNVSFLSHSLID